MEGVGRKNASNVLLAYAFFLFFREIIFLLSFASAKTYKDGVTAV